MISRLLFMLFVVVVQAKKPTIMDVLKNDGRFGILVSALESACLHDYLRKATGGHRSDEYTVFAPTDEAFESLAPQEMEYIQSNLYTVIQHHVIKKKALIASLLDGDRHLTFSRGYVNVAVSNDIMIDDAKIITPDVMAKNGVIHVIDKVLIAQDAAV